MTGVIFVVAFVACLAGGYGLPWWWPAVAGIVLGWLVSGRFLRNVLSAAAGAAAAWAVIAAYINTKNHGFMADKVAALFHLPNGWWLVAVAALIGGVTMALGVWCGRGFRKLR